MSRGTLISSQIQRLFETGTLSGLSEWQLLDRFARSGDQTAFELLVSRHGPMVLGVCRRILHDPSDVDDAFQATFLVLIRRARSLGPGDVVAAWLHGVASKVARRARADRARLNRRESGTAVLETPDQDRPDVDFALRAVLDEEIERLPWKYRAPVALFYLEGLTHEETARRLDWPVGTVKGRLARARLLLGSRLSRRGINTAAGSFTGLMGIEAVGQAAVSESLLAATLRASMRIADGGAWETVVSSHVANLVRGAVTAMIFSNLKILGALLIVSGTVLTGAGVMARQQAGPVEDAALPAESKPPAGDAISPVSESQLLLNDQDNPSEAASEAGATSSERVGDAPLAKPDDLGEAVLKPADSGLADGGAMPDVAQEEQSEADAPSDEAADDESNPRSQAILKKLDEPLPMNFPNETPLEDVLKYIKQATQTPTNNGIAIYVDPIGLNEAEKTLTSPISIDLDGVPLKRTLQLCLKQIDLVYFVEDGILVITSSEQSEKALGSPMAEKSLLLENQEKARRGELNVEEMKDLIEQMKLIREIEHLQHESSCKMSPGGMGGGILPSGTGGGHQ